jgi:CBS domain-containing protein
MGQAGTEGLGVVAERFLGSRSASVRTLRTRRSRTSAPTSDTAPPTSSSTSGRPAGLRDTSAHIMITTPKTLPTRASVDDVRAQMADDHVHMVLLTDGDTLRGTVVRTDLPPAGSGHEAALRWAVLRDRTVSPDTPTALVQARLNHAKMRRLAVVDADDTLLGLVCLKRSRSGFCSDADVAARKDAAAATPRMESPHARHVPDEAR